MSETTVVVGFEDQVLQEAVLQFLERRGGLRVLGAAADAEAFERRLRESRPDAAVVSPPMIESASDLDGASLFVVAERETSGGLRAAIRAGAQGFYLWPEERDTLANDAARAGVRREERSGPRGRVVAVHGARGGAGVTFLATNLAAACTREGSSTVLIEADPFHADVNAALGVGSTQAVRTSAELAAVADELSVEHLERVLYNHPKGFRVLLGPQDPSQWSTVRASTLARAADVLRQSFEIVLVHVPRGIDAALPLLEVADDVLLVVTLDVLAFRDAKRLLALLETMGLSDRCRLVVNRAARAEVIPEDAERVFGLRPSAVLRVDRSVPRAQNRGELIVDRGGQMAKRLRALAGLLIEEVGA